MFSVRIIPHQLRCYSTNKEVRKLWVKHNGSPPIKVSTESCTDIDDFAKKVKHELNTNSQVALYSSLEKEALDPGVAVKDLLNVDFMKNTSKAPLFVKILPVTQDPMNQKLFTSETLMRNANPLILILKW